MNSRKVTAIILAAAMTVTSALPAFAAEAEAAAVDIDAAAVAIDTEAEESSEAQAADTLPAGVEISGIGEVAVPEGVDLGMDLENAECTPVTQEEMDAFKQFLAENPAAVKETVDAAGTDVEAQTLTGGDIYTFSGYKWVGWNYTHWNYRVRVFWNNGAYKYTGKKVKPITYLFDVTSTSDDNLTTNNQLKEGRDYKLVLKNAKNASASASFVVKGKGKYKHVNTAAKKSWPVLYYTIAALNFEDADITIPDYAVPYKAGKVQMTKPKLAFLGSNKLSKNDYSIEFPDQSKSGAYEALGSYTVTIKPGRSGNITGSKKVTLIVSDKPQARKFKVKYTKKQYASGSGVKPNVEVTFKKTPLTQGKDYKVSYANNVYPGKGLIIIQGIGEYTGTVVKMFKIKS